MAFERLAAIAEKRCPACLAGPMYQGTFTMYEHCPVCGHRFMREPGYFQGAMYVSYVMGIGTFAALLLGAKALLEPRYGFVVASVVAIAIQGLLVPVLFQYSRVIWAHLNIGTRQSGSEPG